MILSFAQLIAYLEILNIISSIILFKKKCSPKMQNIIFILITPIIFAIIKGTYNFLDITEDIYIADLPIVISQIILIILLALIIYMYKKMNIDRSYKWIIIVSLLIVLSNLFIMLTVVLNKNFSLFICITKLLSYFLAYDKIEETFLYNSYASAYESLNRAKEIKTNLNKNLKRREKELKELNLLLEKSEKKYYDVVQAFSDGLLLFENDIMIYSNYYEEEYYNIHDGIACDQNKLKLTNILNKIAEEEYVDGDEVNDFTADVRNERGEEKKLEVNLVKIYDNKKILVFNDVTEIIKQRDEIS